MESWRFEPRLQQAVEVRQCIASSESQHGAHEASAEESSRDRMELV